MPAEVGYPYIYDHADNKGYGEHYRGDVLTAEMTELDLKDGTPVFVIAIEEETGRPFVDWTDSVGIYRITSVDPADFDLLFTPDNSRSKKLCHSYQQASYSSTPSSRPSTRCS
jgi:hypothetical protein